MLIKIASIVFLLLILRFILIAHLTLNAYKQGVGFINSILKKYSRANILAVTEFGGYFKKRKVLKDFFNFKLCTFYQYTDEDYKNAVLNAIKKASEDNPDGVIINSSKESI